MNKNKAIMERKAQDLQQSLSYTGLVHHVVVFKSKWSDNFLLKIIWN